MNNIYWLNIYIHIRILGRVYGLYNMTIWLDYIIFPGVGAGPSFLGHNWSFSYQNTVIVILPISSLYKLAATYSLISCILSTSASYVTILSFSSSVQCFQNLNLDIRHLCFNMSLFPQFLHLKLDLRLFTSCFHNSFLLQPPFPQYSHFIYIPFHAYFSYAFSAIIFRQFLFHTFHIRTIHQEDYYINRASMSSILRCPYFGIKNSLFD